MITTSWPLLPYQHSAKAADLLYTNFRHLLRAKTEEAPDREFLIFPETDRKYTYREFYDLTIVAAEWLRTRTRDFGTISIIFRNTPEFLSVFFSGIARHQRCADQSGLGSAGDSFHSGEQR